jgi:hypothetical protein
MIYEQEREYIFAKPSPLPNKIKAVSVCSSAPSYPIWCLSPFRRPISLPLLPNDGDAAAVNPTFAIPAAEPAPVAPSDRFVSLHVAAKSFRCLFRPPGASSPHPPPPPGGSTARANVPLRLSSPPHARPCRGECRATPPRILQPYPSPSSGTPLDSRRDSSIFW